MTEERLLVRRSRVSERVFSFWPAEEEMTAATMKISMTATARMMSLRILASKKPEGDFSVGLAWGAIWLRYDRLSMSSIIA